MTSKLKKIIISILAGAVIIFSWIIWGDKMDKKIVEAYNNFYTSDIRGQLESTSIKYHMTSFKMQEDNQEYIFSPYTDINGHIFDAVSKPGDSIIKPAYSDTILVKKRNEEFKFSFTNLLKD